MSGVRVSGDGHSRENGDPGQSLKDTARPHRLFIRTPETQVEVRLLFDIVNIVRGTPAHAVACVAPLCVAYAGFSQLSGS